jgi:hypothetical protein
MRSKLRILRAIVDLSPILGGEDYKKAISKILTKIGKYPHRNMIAHNSFRADPSNDGVVFEAAQLKGSHDRASQTWSSQRFAEEYLRLSQFREGLAELNRRLDNEAVLSTFSRETMTEILVSMLHTNDEGRQ